jgi:hypothetical protein
MRVLSLSLSPWQRLSALAYKPRRTEQRRWIALCAKVR